MSLLWNLASMPQSGQKTVTPQQAAQVGRADEQKLVARAEQHDPAMIDRLSEAMRSIRCRSVHLARQRSE